MKTRHFAKIRFGEPIVTFNAPMNEFQPVRKTQAKCFRPWHILP